MLLRSHGQVLSGIRSRCTPEEEMEEDAGGGLAHTRRSKSADAYLAVSAEQVVAATIVSAKFGRASSAGAIHLGRRSQLVPRVNLDGHWRTHKEGEDLHINGYMLSWHSGIGGQIVDLGKNHFCAEIDYQMYYAELVGDKLFWTDGDVWERQRAMTTNLTSLSWVQSGAACERQDQEQEQEGENDSEDIQQKLKESCQVAIETGQRENPGPSEPETARTLSQLEVLSFAGSMTRQASHEAYGSFAGASLQEEDEAKASRAGQGEGESPRAPAEEAAAAPGPGARGGVGLRHQEAAEVVSIPGSSRPASGIRPASGGGDSDAAEELCGTLFSDASLADVSAASALRDR